MSVIRTLVSLTVAAALAGPALAQQTPKPGASGTVMYKCLDDRGRAYYSDKLAPECNQVEEMNRHGRVVKKLETTKPGPATKPLAEDGKVGTKDIVGKATPRSCADRDLHVGGGNRRRP